MAGWPLVQLLFHATRIRMGSTCKFYIFSFRTFVQTRAAANPRATRRRHASIAWRRDCLWWRKHGAAQGIDGMFVLYEVTRRRHML